MPAPPIETIIFLIDVDRAVGLTIDGVTAHAGDPLPDRPGHWGALAGPELTARMVEVLATVAALQAQTHGAGVPLRELARHLWDDDAEAAEAFFRRRLGAGDPHSPVTLNGDQVAVRARHVLFRPLNTLADDPMPPFDLLERVRRAQHLADEPRSEGLKRSHARVPRGAGSGYGPSVPPVLTFADWDDLVPIEAVPVRDPKPRRWANPTFEDAVVVMAIHAGHVMPSAFEPTDQVFDEQLRALYRHERDWGSERVAELVARELGLSHYHRVNVARVLMDFGRFPGQTAPHAGHLDRHAISGPFSSRLSREEMRQVLTRLYDRISERVEAEIGCGDRRRILLLSLHTYDPTNPEPPYTQRQHVSLVHTAQGYSRDKRMPFNVFDPAFPDRLGESTADPKLVSRIALTLASLSPEDYRKGLGGSWDGRPFRIGFNHPYELPDGSLEVRSQVWTFFDFVRRAFEADGGAGGAASEAAYAIVWRMLMDTNLRDVDSVALRSYLHMIREAPDRRLLYHPPGDGAPIRLTFGEAETAYEEIVRFIRESDAVERFERDPRRFSALAIEVRKDLVWDYHLQKPVESASAFREDVGQFVAHHLSRAVIEFIETDARSNEGWEK